MNFEEFFTSLTGDKPPKQISAYLKSLWYDAKNDWHKSHEIAQDIADQRGSHIHAYLHRKEGDHSNAAYWYRRAGKPMPAYPLEKEWEEIVKSELSELGF